MAFSCILMSRECTGCGECLGIPPGPVICDFCGGPITPGEGYVDLDGEKMCEDCISLRRREA